MINPIIYIAIMSIVTSMVEIYVLSDYEKKTVYEEQRNVNGFLVVFC